MAAWWWLLGDGRLPSAGLGVTQCSIQELLALLGKCFPGQFPPTHFNCVCTWQLDNSLIFTCMITSPCKSRDCHHQGWRAQQPGLSDSVTDVGNPFVSHASPSHKIGPRKGFVLWILVFPRPCNTRTTKNNKNKADIYWGHPLSKTCLTTLYALSSSQRIL